MMQIILIKSNGFIDVIESDYEISNEYIDMESIECLLENESCGIYRISNLKIKHDSGQEGDSGSWEIQPYYYINDCKIKKLCDIDNYVTKAERTYLYDELKEKRKEKLQKFIASFSTKTIKYELCKVWQFDKLALREVSGESFQIFKTIHQFESDTASKKNISEIRKWCLNYFSEIKENERATM